MRLWFYLPVNSLLKYNSESNSQLVDQSLPSEEPVNSLLKYNSESNSQLYVELKTLL